MKQAIKKHLPHIEDLLVEEGIAGLRNFKKHVNAVVDKATQPSFFHSEQEVNQKIDGSMMLLFGIDPRPGKEGQFFIATKSGLSQKNPKLLHTYKDIDECYSEPTLNKKLRALLPILLRSYPPNGLTYQCDVIFTKKSDKKVKTIDREKYLTFTPNLITYAVPYNRIKDSLCSRINTADVGIVIHEALRCEAAGNSIKLSPLTRKLGPHFLRSMNERAELFCITSNIPQLVLRDAGALRSVPEFLLYVEKTAKKISPKFWDRFLDSSLQEHLKLFLNKEVEKASRGFHGDLFLDVRAVKESFKNFIFDRFEAEKLTKKTPAGVSSTSERCNKLICQVTECDTAMTLLLEATHVMSRIKRLLLYAFFDMLVLQNLGKTFIQHEDGKYEKVFGEGFVLFIKDSHVKVVDRCVFSRLNRISNKRFKPNEKETRKEAEANSARA